METLQQQLTVVNTKIEAIHQKIEVISAQMDELLTSVRCSDESKAEAGRSGSNPLSSKVEMHRDVLSDDQPIPLTSSQGQTISYELQTQRLMAQLTAAYSRIAALEEQLMSQRLH